MTTTIRYYDERTRRIYSRVDDILATGVPHLLDSHISQLRLAELSADEMLAYMVAIQPMAAQLSSYSRFYERVRKALVSRGHMHPGFYGGCIVAPSALQQQMPLNAQHRRTAQRPAPPL